MCNTFYKIFKLIIALFFKKKLNKSSEAQIAGKIRANQEQSEAEIKMLRKKNFSNNGETQQAITITYFNSNKLQL